MNKHRKIVIIGCGAGGSTAAQFARKTDRKSKITIFEKEKYSQYSKCGLPYVISGKINQYNDLIEFSEEWYKKANIELYLNTEVNRVDFNTKIIYAKEDDTKIERSYDQLIIATGSKPIIPPIKNISKENKLVNGVFNLRTIDDAKKIEKYVKKDDKATIIGAGLIGLEMADSLYKKGMNVCVIESLPKILPKTFDEDISKSLSDKITKYIKLYIGYLATEIEIKNGGINKLHIKNNLDSTNIVIDTNLLILATGTKPVLSDLKQQDLKIGKTGGIIVNNKCETSIKDVYSVGDCTEYKDFITKKPINIGLGSIVVRQGITAGINSAGGKYELLEGFLQTCTSEFFGIEIATVGPTIENLHDFPTISAKYNGRSLPEYFPGGKPITLKITINKKTREIISAQGIGDKAAQRINTIACAILNKINIEIFRKLETAYAPPIAPTLDVTTLVCDILVMKINRDQ
jgi:NADH oxidase (H2O2-forming)